MTGVTAVSDLIKLSVRPVRGRENVMSMSYSTGRFYTITGREQASDTSDVALLRSISAGDKHAMQTLFACHNVRVFRFLLRFVADRAAAEDLVSEVFLDVWRQAGRFEADPRSRPGFWRLPAIRPCRHCSAGRSRNWVKMWQQPSRTHMTTRR